MTIMPHPSFPVRTGGQLIVDSLAAQGVDHVFCVPGESYLAVLDALHDVAINVTVCRQEGGAVMMADATARLTGRPGIAMVTRGPGATNASPGIHIAEHDSVPLILFGLAAQHLPLRYIGFMQYLTPTIQFILGGLLLPPAGVAAWREA
jgi:thiamine pyrophosphate-dependent acetolactate synthase large subunit-like protein